MEDVAYEAGVLLVRVAVNATQPWEAEDTYSDSVQESGAASSKRV
jgi:hypothetical protein